MADKAAIQWKVKATPVIVDEYTIADSSGGDLDGTGTRYIKKTTDGAIEVGGTDTTTYEGANPERVGGKTNVLSSTTTTTSLSTIAGFGTKSIQLIAVEIVGLYEDNTDADLLIALDDENVLSDFKIRMWQVGHAVVIQLLSTTSDHIHICSTVSSKRCYYNINWARIN